MPKNWNTITELYIDVSDCILDYCQGVIGNEKATNELQQVCYTIVDRLIVNLKNIQFLLSRLEEDKHFFFLSIALLQRAILSDIIIFWYMKHISETENNSKLKLEIFSVNRGFVEAYKQMIEEEMNIRDNKDAYLENMERIKKLFPLHFTDDGSLVGRKSSTETDKIKVMSYNNKGSLKILFKYFAQFQHFSTKMQMLYRDKSFVALNQMYSYLLLQLIVDMLKEIVVLINPKKSYLEQLIAIDKKINIESGNINFGI